MKFIDLFSGAGGFSSGIIRSGHEVKLAIDNWTAACETYSQNFKHDIKNEDLSDVDKILDLLKGYDFDFIVGGPPCQDFSPAGIGIEGLRANLTVKFAEIVAKSNCNGFIMENVPQVSNSEAYQKALKIFKEKEYGLTQIVVDANYYRVPQRRKRLFLIGHKEFTDNYFNDFLEYQHPLPMCVHEGFPSISIKNYYRHPRTYSRRAVFSIYEPSPTIRGVNRPRPQSYKSHPGDSSKDQNIRSLTFKERSAIQSFDEQFKWVGSETDINQMIGNAVPPELAKSLITYLVDKITKNKKLTFTDFLESKDIYIHRERVEKILRSINSIDPIYKHKNISSYTLQNPIQDINKNILEAYYEFYK